MLQDLSEGRTGWLEETEGGGDFVAKKGGVFYKGAIKGTTGDRREGQRSRKLNKNM